MAFLEQTVTVTWTVNIMTASDLEDRVRFLAVAEICSTPPRQNQLWDPPRLQASGYCGLLPAEKRSGRERDYASLTAPVNNLVTANIYDPISLLPVSIRREAG
jgi:hypothetical protein